MNIDDITYQIRGAIFEVNKVLGYGFLEKVYEKALMIELSLSVEICPLRRNASGNGLQKMTAHQSEEDGIRSPAGRDQLCGCGG